jgi:hypothetical protein
MEQGTIGDHIIEERNGKTVREGEILKVVGIGDEAHYRVRWEEEKDFHPEGNATFIHKHHERGGDPVTIFWLQTGYLAVLAILAFLYFTSPRFVDIPNTLGPIPVGVPWFGALGATLISIVGLTDHRHEWDSSYRFFHWSRPLIGGSLGVISVLVLQAGILAVGSTPTASTAVPRDLLYYLLAFLVGYREQTFRALIVKLTDVLLGPGETPASQPGVTSVTPPK